MKKGVPKDCTFQKINFRVKFDMTSITISHIKKSTMIYSHMKLSQTLFVSFLCMLGSFIMSDSKPLQLSSYYGDAISLKLREPSTLREEAIYFGSISDGNMKKIFFDENIFVNFQSLSSKGDRIAIKGDYFDLNSAVYQKHKKAPQVLLVIDTVGNVLNRIDMELIRGYSWSPAGDKIVFIEGKRSDKDDFWRPEYGKAIWVLDAVTGTKNILCRADSNQNFQDVTWEKFDGNIYVKMMVHLEYGTRHGIFKYDLAKMSFVPTPYKSLDFSPDGKYYYYWDDSPVHLIYSRETNEPVTFGQDSNFQLLDWFSDGRNTYALGFAPGGFYVVNLDTGRDKLVSRPDENLRIPFPVGVSKGKPMWIKSNENGSLQIFTR